ncbi:MAG: 30S ribosomal protein S16 [Nitrospiraceae bacterium]|nr:30S ribosomal protein S16 [Nitrospiraceae bacterium]MDA8325279.1 30S ribosomal protein S16 [Nitrospiraceae bacterium]
MVKIRLMRMGAHKSPSYRIVVANSAARRDGPFVEILGTYDPKKNPFELKVDGEKAQKWLKQGAQPTDTVRKLLVKAGVLSV